MREPDTAPHTPNPHEDTRDFLSTQGTDPHAPVSSSETLPARNDPANLDVLVFSGAVPPTSLLARLRKALSCHNLVLSHSLEQALVPQHLDVAIVDLTTPGGLDALSALSAHLPALPLVGLGPGDSASELRALRLGALEYLDADDLDTATLFRCIKRAIERGRIESELRESESKYRMFVEHSPDGYLVVSKQNIVLEANYRACEMFGCTEAEFVGEQLDHFLLPEELQAEPMRVHEVLSGRTVLRERTIVRRDGSRLSAEGATRALPDGKVQIVVRDITERKRVAEELRALNEELEERVAERTAELRSLNQHLRNEIAERLRIEEALLVSEERFSRAFRSSPDSIAITTVRDSTVIDANESFYKLTGYTAEDAVGKTVTELGIWHIPEERRAALEIMNRQGSIRDFPWHLHMKSGEIRNALLSVELIHLRGEACFLSICHDITEQKRAEDALRVAHEGLQIAMTELEAFSYSVSHDLQAPLRAISGYSTALIDEYSEALSDQGVGYLRRIQFNTRKMSELIEDLLTFSRTARQEMKAAFVDMVELTREITAGLDLERPGGHVEVKIGELPPVRGDRSMLRSVLTNLLGNGVKFTRPVEHALIEVDSYPDPEAPGERQVFYVRDNGVGFDMQYMNKLFVVFQRLHTSAEFEGTGVGLAIVQRIVNRHGGRVWAEGRVGEGATFYFSLPLYFQE